MAIFNIAKCCEKVNVKIKNSSSRSRPHHFSHIHQIIEKHGLFMKSNKLFKA